MPRFVSYKRLIYCSCSCSSSRRYLWYSSSRLKDWSGVTQAERCCCRRHERSTESSASLYQRCSCESMVEYLMLFSKRFSIQPFHHVRNFSVHVHLTWAGIIEVLLSVENRLDFLNLVPGLKVVLGIDRVFSTAAIVLFRVVRKWAQRLLFLKAIF